MQPSTWVTRRDRISRVQEFSTPFFAVPGYGSCCRSVLQASGIPAASDSLSPVVD